MSSRGGAPRKRGGNAHRGRGSGRRDFTDRELHFDGPPPQDDPSENEEDDSEEENETTNGASRPAGPGTPITEVYNPNRNAKPAMKLSDLGKTPAAGSGDDMFRGDGQLSRKEREAMEKERAREAYMKKHLAGQTEEAKRDLARLAQIRKEREEAARKREEEKLAKEAGKAGKKSESLNASKATITKRLG
ncbi:heat- and acid-stable phosphoprotein [Gonapodya sp. JEL0774]|nr:heat- and acid-stable phosphoprotein [Gonapodya sp. JEL0774]